MLGLGQLPIHKVSKETKTWRKIGKLQYLLTKTANKWPQQLHIALTWDLIDSHPLILLFAAIEISNCFKNIGSSCYNWIQISTMSLHFERTGCLSYDYPKFSWIRKPYVISYNNAEFLAKLRSYQDEASRIDTNRLTKSVLPNLLVLPTIFANGGRFSESNIACKLPVKLLHIPRRSYLPQTTPTEVTRRFEFLASALDIDHAERWFIRKH